MLRKLASASMLVLALALPAAAEDLKVRIGVEGNYPPFSQVNADGTLAGFDIDIAGALCAAMAAECDLVQQEWDGMIPALNAEKFDMIVASMTITEERLKAVDFSEPYYDVPSRWVAADGAFAAPTAEALAGKTIIVLRNSPRADYVAENFPDSRILQVTKETDVYLELASGRGDIGFGSSVVSGEAFLKTPQGEGFAKVGEPVRLDGGSGGVGIAIRKDDGDLLGRVNTALAAIKASGEYDALQAKYFDFDISGS